MARLDITALRKAVWANRYLITTHAKQRMGQRRVSDREVKQAIVVGDVIEQHDDAIPFPKALFMKQFNEEPLYVSCAFDGKRAYIITVHWYDPNLWIDPWTRKKGS